MEAIAKKVLVGMSGGVDSSVAAAILKDEGYEVIGVSMKLWSDKYYGDTCANSTCCSLEDINDARMVAYKLGIPHYVLNFKEYFHDKVVEPFIRGYRSGLTPNPCISCNRYVKFEELLRKARMLGCEYIATGHYSRIVYNEQTRRYEMRRAADEKKDQSYVLYNLRQDQLARILMPLGNYDKETVREYAKRLELPVHDKAESQEICFVEDNDYASFIERNISNSVPEGNFLDIRGNIIGRHKGIHRYTIGQRKGLGASFGKPMYVVDIDAIENTVILGEESDQYRKGLIADDLNFLPFEKLKKPKFIEAMVRYNSSPQKALLIPFRENKVQVIFAEKQKAIALGQAVVFYDGNEVIGGGTIVNFCDNEFNNTNETNEIYYI